MMRCHTSLILLSLVAAAVSATNSPTQKIGLNQITVNLEHLPTAASGSVSVPATCGSDGAAADPNVCEEDLPVPAQPGADREEGEAYPAITLTQYKDAGCAGPRAEVHVPNGECTNIADLAKKLGMYGQPSLASLLQLNSSGNEGVTHLKGTCSELLQDGVVNACTDSACKQCEKFQLLAENQCGKQVLPGAGSGPAPGSASWRCRPKDNDAATLTYTDYTCSSCSESTAKDVEIPAGVCMKLKEVASKIGVTSPKLFGKDLGRFIVANGLTLPADAEVTHVTGTCRRARKVLLMCSDDKCQECAEVRLSRENTCAKSMLTIDQADGGGRSGSWRCGSGWAPQEQVVTPAPEVDYSKLTFTFSDHAGHGCKGEGKLVPLPFHKCVSLRKMAQMVGTEKPNYNVSEILHYILPADANERLEAEASLTHIAVEGTCESRRLLVCTDVDCNNCETLRLATENKCADSVLTLGATDDTRRSASWACLANAPKLEDPSDLVDDIGEMKSGAIARHAVGQPGAVAALLVSLLLALITA